MNYAGILASGKGERMGKSRPKQFLCLGDDDTPIIIRTLNEFVLAPQIDKIVIAASADWIEFVQELIASNFTQQDAARIFVIEGGKERFDSLNNICKFIESSWGLAEDDILVSHDAVRPFVTQRIISENIEAAHAHGCVDTVVPATDTIVVSEDAEKISNIPLRSNYYQGQTPQSFQIKAYNKAFDALSDEQKSQLTDACKVFLFSDLPVHLVMGEYSNIKITTPHDIYVARAIIHGIE